MNTQPKLITLQPEQQVHDHKAHADILSLRTSERIAHMTLHFCKYVGRLFEGTVTTEQQLKALVTDTAIITLASANALNIQLHRRISRCRVQECISSLGYSRSLKVETFSALLGRRLAILTSKLAKACESWDHAEAFPYREVWEANVVCIAELVVAAADVLELDLDSEVRARWREIEQNSIFDEGQKNKTFLTEVG